jgi:hypothetical protein
MGPPSKHTICWGSTWKSKAMAMALPSNIGPLFPYGAAMPTPKKP